MKYEIEKEKLEEFYTTVNELEDLLTDRISDLHGMKGATQARHAYLFYRRLLWDARASIREGIKEVEEKAK